MEENAIPLNFLSQRRTRNKTYSSIRDSLQEENESRDHLRARQNTRTVVVMVSLYALGRDRFVMVSASRSSPKVLMYMAFAAFAISALHVGFYYWLNDRIVDESIPQEPQTFVSNMFSIAFELASLGCIGVAYTQRLWQLFRQVPINALTIDHLFTLPRNPMHLFHGRIFRKAPVEYLVGIVCALLPIAITFPPSAVNIAPRQIPPIPRRLGPVNSFEILDYNQSIADIKELAQNVRERALMYLDSDFNTL